MAHPDSDLGSEQARIAQLEAALRESEEKYHRVVENANEAIVVAQGGKLKLFNRKVTEMSGYTPDQLADIRFLDIVHPDDRDVVASRHRQRLRGEPVPNVYTFRVVDGRDEIRWLELNAVQIEWEGRPATLNFLSDVTERKRAEDALRRRKAQLEALREVGLELAAQLDLDTLLHFIVAQAVDLVEGTAGGLYLYCPEREVLEWGSVVGPSPVPAGSRLHRGEGLSGQVWATRRPVAVDNYLAWSDHVSRYEGLPLKAVAGAPVQWREEFLGVLLIESDAPFSTNDVELLQMLAAQAAVAIRNARLYEETERRALEQETVSRVVSALNTLNVRAAFPVLEEEIQALTGCDWVSLAFVDEGSDEWVISQLDQLDFPPPSVFKGSVSLPLSFSSADEDLRAGRPHWTDDLSLEADKPIEQVLIQAGFRSRVNLPLLAGGNLVGSLNLASFDPAHFRRDQLPVLRQIADALVAAMENWRLFEAERRRRQEADTLREAALALTADLNQEEVIERILAQLQQVVPYDSASVQLFRRGGHLLEIVGGRGFPNLDDLLGATFDPRRGDNPNSQVVRTRSTFIVADAPTKYVGFRRDPHVGADIRSWLGVPMLVGERLIGMIALDRREPGFYTEEHARLSEAFAAQAAVAIENARLHHQVLDYAGELEHRVRERTAELQAEYAQLDAILRHTADGIVVTNAKGVILQTNPVARRWLTQTLLPEEADRLQKMIRHLVTQSEARAELELKGLDLELSVGAISIPALDDAVEERLIRKTTELPAAVVAIHDVSHFRALDRMKTRFVSNISHELRTPVTTIKLYVHLMQQNPSSCQAYLDILAQEADHQAQLVEDVLQISRIDAGRLEMDPHPTSLDDLVDLVIARHATLAQERGLMLICAALDRGDGREAKVTALVDQIRMMQVLNNLVENSIRYTPDGGRVTLATGLREAEGRTWAVVTVADTGMGIPESELPHVFERFFRGEEPRQM